MLDKKKAYKIALFSVLMFILSLFIFIYGYILGLQHEHNYLLSELLPNSVTKLDVGETDMIRKSFYIKSRFNEKNVSILNTVSFPHSWYFDEDVNNDNKDIIGSKKYVISSPNEKVTLTIIPKKINNLRSVMSATTFVTQEIKEKCLGSYNISESEEFKSVELYREIVDSNNIKYTQEISSVANPTEDASRLDEFLVFKRDGGFIEGNELVWTADILLEFDGSVPNEEKDAYLLIIDEIVSSLQIK